MANYKITADTRTVLGRKVKRLRKEGILPANIFGKKVKSTAIQLPIKEFAKVFSEAGETSIIEVELNKTKHPVLVSNIQVDPLSNNPIHVDFMEVDLKEKVTAQVPVEVVGESPAEKQGLGTVVQYVDEIEVEALPTDLPEQFIIDLTKLEEVDQQVKIGDIKYDSSKVEIKDDMETIVVKVEPQREEEPEPVAPAEEVEAETPSDTTAETPDTEASKEAE